MCVSLCVHVYVFPNSFCLQELRKLSRASLLVRNCSFKRYSVSHSLLTKIEDSPPARLIQVQFALNRKHAFFDATP